MTPAIADIVAVGGNPLNKTCLTYPATPHESDFYFAFGLDSSVTNRVACSTEKIDWSNTSSPMMRPTLPVRIVIVIPGGSVFEIPTSSVAENDYVNWNIDLPVGTQFMMYLMDQGKYGTGGFTQLHNVVASGASNGEACINSNSPQASPAEQVPRPTSGPGSQLPSGSPPAASPSSSSSPSSPASSSKSSTGVGVIVGPIVAAVAVILLGIIGFLFWRRRRSNRRDSAMDTIDMADDSDEPGMMQRNHHTPLLQSPQARISPFQPPASGADARTGPSAKLTREEQWQQQGYNLGAGNGGGGGDGYDDRTLHGPGSTSGPSGPSGSSGSDWGEPAKETPDGLAAKIATLHTLLNDRQVGAALGSSNTTE